MLNDTANNYTAQQKIDLERWLIAENTFHTNSVHATMYRKQLELTAQLHEALENCEHLAAPNTELQERVTTVTEAYATLFGDGMNLAELNQHASTAFHNRDPRWCTQAAAVMCRSA
jgi:hypothetical protein